ncbi:MAG: hypothetical protein AABX90_03155 [Nanoarchaeota archaeon]
MNSGITEDKFAIALLKKSKSPSSHVLLTQFIFALVNKRVIIETISKNADAPAQENL